MERILFFDGVCNLCNGAVQWVIAHDRTNSILFAALQSETATARLLALGVQPARLESLVLLENGRAYTHSDAVLRLAGALGAPWSWLRVVVFLPKPLRDGVYNWIAKHRYAWFGQRDSCMMPTPELKKRFLS